MEPGDAVDLPDPVADTQEPPPAVTPAPAPATPAPASSAGGVMVDDVRFTAAEAQAALAFINSASEAELKAAGVYGRGVGIILEARPFSSLQAVGDTPYIGNKTLESVRWAVTHP